MRKINSDYQSSGFYDASCACKTCSQNKAAPIARLQYHLGEFSGEITNDELAGYLIGYMHGLQHAD